MNKPNGNLEKTWATLGNLWRLLNYLRNFGKLWESLGNFGKTRLFMFPYVFGSASKPRSGGENDVRREGPRKKILKWDTDWARFGDNLLSKLHVLRNQPNPILVHPDSKT